MLNETLDRSMAQARAHEILTKASKFSNVFKNISRDKSFQEEIMHSKIDKYIQKGVDTSTAIKESLYDTSNWIIENPEEIKVDFSFNTESSGTPFFRSLYNKLLAEENNIDVEPVAETEILEENARSEVEKYVSSLYGER